MTFLDGLDVAAAPNDPDHRAVLRHILRTEGFTAFAEAARAALAENVTCVVENWSATRPVTVADLQLELPDHAWVVAYIRGGPRAGVLGQMPSLPPGNAVWQLMVRCGLPFGGSLCVEYENVTTDVGLTRRIHVPQSRRKLWFDRKTLRLTWPRDGADCVPLLCGPFGVGDIPRLAVLLDTPLSRGQRYYVAYHASYRKAVLRHKSSWELKATWEGRRWQLFGGETPHVVDVTVDVARVIVERLGATRAWRARHAIVLREDPDAVRVVNVALDIPCWFYRLMWSVDQSVLPLAIEHPPGEPPAVCDA
jgi:hypothetical protein